MADWNPALYLTFEKERTQPSVDLANRISLSAPNRILDVGCGPGNSTMVLKEKWPHAEITGVDNSPAMVQQAQKLHPELLWHCADASKDLSHLGTFDIIFSNAAIQWIQNQQALLFHLFSLLNKGGVLAVQVPCAINMPAYIVLKEQLETPFWNKRFTSLTAESLLHTADFYYEVLSPLTTELQLWETEYYHILNSHDDIITWYSSTKLNPYLECLSLDERNSFLSEYKTRLHSVYPLQKNNKILFPFTRIFFTAQK